MVDLIEDGPKIVAGLIVVGLLRRKIRKDRAPIPEGVLAQYQVQVQDVRGAEWIKVGGFATWEEAEEGRKKLLPAVTKGDIYAVRNEKVIL